MKKILFLFVTISLLTTNVTEAQSKKELKEEKKAAEYKVTKALIESGTYGFEASYCNTQKGRRIDLTSNGDSLIIDGSLSGANLPYFGVAQVSNMGGDAGITFENDNTEYNIEYNDKKYKITIRFKAKNKTEVFDVFITVFGNRNTTVGISSSQRNYISFGGDIAELKKPE